MANGKTSAPALFPASKVQSCHLEKTELFGRQCSDQTDKDNLRGGKMK